jgi:iduronate 2-sulfatase
MRKWMMLFQPFRPIVCLLAFAFVASVAYGQAKETAGRRPNVLFIAVDDLRPELGCYGSKHIKSPHIDALAESGVTFTRAYCQVALCNPSRASLMTGLRPDTLRVWDLETDFRSTRPDALTLAECFKQQGYHAVDIGKIFHHNIPDPRSWSESLHIDGYPFYPGVVYRNPETVAKLDRRREELLRQGNQESYLYRWGHRHLKDGATECADVPDNAYCDGAQTDVALKKLSSLKGQAQPFFFAVGYYRPHLPFNAPKKYWDLYDRRTIPLAENDFLPRGAPLAAINTLRELRDYEDFKDAPRPDQGPLTEAQARLLRHGYFASVSYVDAQIGRLLDGLKQLGLEKNTLVILWGDNGWKLGEHRSWCKMTNYEIDARVPLIVRVPGAKENGQVCDRLVEFVDIYPTLCELAGLTPPAELEGTSFAPLLDHRAQPWKTAAFHQFLRAGKWSASDGVEYMGYAIRTERHRYVEWFEWQTKKFVARELYDQHRDPREDANLADLPENKPLVGELSKRLHAGWKAALPPNKSEK